MANDLSDPKIEWTRTGTEQGEDLKLFQVRHDWMQHPTSGAVMKRLILESVDWINVVALTPERESVMVVQYRFGVSECTIETPGGMVDPGETPLLAAQRELLEETGYGGGRWRYLGAVEPNPAIHDHLCHHYLAEDVERVQAPDLGGGEAIRVELHDLKSLGRAVRDGQLRHVLALSALSRVFGFWDVDPA